MESLSKIPVDVLLRNFLAGLFFFSGLIAVIGIPKEIGPIGEISGGFVSLLSLASLAVGTAVYGVLRAIWIPILERFAFQNEEKDHNDDLFDMDRTAVEYLLIRWKWAAEKGHRKTFYASALKSWADYIHYLFASAFSLGLGVVSGWFIEADMIGLGIFLVVVILITAGCIADGQRHYIERRCVKDVKEKIRDE